MTNATSEDPGAALGTVLTSLGVYLIVSGVVGSTANGLALFIFYSNKHLRSPTNSFIISLLVCDLCMCLMCTPMPAASNIAHRWLFGRSGCIYHAFAVYYLGLTNLYLLTAISVDRYFVIAKPLIGVRINYRVVGISIFLCHFFGLFWSLMPVFGWSTYALEGAGTSCAISYEKKDPLVLSFNVTIFFTCYFIPLCIMVFCYYSVFMTVRKMTKNTAFGKSSRIAKRNWRLQKKLAKTIIIMIGVFFFAWTPYAVTAFWAAFGLGEVPVIASTIPSMFAKTASVWNPFIYVFTNKQFRKTLYSKVPCGNLRQRLMNADRDEDNDDESSSGPDDNASSTRAGISTIEIQQRNITAPGVHPAQEMQQRNITAPGVHPAQELQQGNTTEPGVHPAQEPKIESSCP